MTFGELQQDVYADTGANNPAPAPGTVDRIARYLNRAHREILTEHGLIRLRHTGMPLTFTSEADRLLYGLPSSLASVRSITERDTHRLLVPMTLDELRFSDPALTSSGTPHGFIPIGYKPIQEAPLSTGLWVASSSSSDTAIVAQIRGVLSGGSTTSDQTATLSGTSRVAVGTFTDYVDVLEFTINSHASGMISLYDAASSGNTLAEIPIGQATSRYFVVQLYPTTTDGVVYYVDGVYRILTMAEAQDQPQLPEEFHDLVSLRAKELEFIKANDQRALVCRADYESGLSKLRYWVSCHGAEVPVVARRTQPRASRYGGMFPLGPF